MMFDSLSMDHAVMSSSPTKSTPVRMKDGAILQVNLLGDDPGKPLVIVHHGAPGLSSREESEASFGFLSKTFRVLSFDARGSGRSSSQPPYTHAQWVADVDELRWANHLSSAQQL